MIALSVPIHRSPDGSFCPRQRRIYVLLAAIVASSLGFIDGSIVAIAIPAIRGDLGASLPQAQWISNAYALTLSALILTGGAAGDRFGLRRTFMAGIVFFVVMSLVCAAAPNPSFLIAARGLQGIGAAFMIPGSLAIIAKAYPKAERGRAIGIWAASSALTTALGPILGGFILSTFGDTAWRAIFAVNLPLGMLVIALLLRVPADKPSRPRHLDLAGVILATIAFGGLAYGLSAAGAEKDGSTAAPVFVSIATGAIALVVFLVWELRQREPMVKLSLFRSRAFSGANVATFFLYFALSGVLFYLPMLLIAGWGMDAATTGFVFLPLSLAIALFSGPVGKWADATGPRLPISAGSLVVSMAFAGLAIATSAEIHRFWQVVFPLMVLMGLGMALVVSPLSTAVMTAVEDEDTGAASGINNAVSRIAGLIAVAALGSLAAYRYQSIAGGSDGMPGFGEPSGGLSASLEMTRVAASDAAFSLLAWTVSALCLFAAATAWATQAGGRKEEKRGSPPEQAG
ncbi:DHA2 family efflux MFS transporter permease subunit [Phyllobacterium phragmitis]|uniref:DHA2 family efflux MFS transporter permease subunit n=1 Tax=Phyllobacterium phragmitis TaxID=2670329 RepID=UPI0018EE338C|nr:DHA2 family efflux MFS transporter permease subunit [Phyllobacterium phragmitis]